MEKALRPEHPQLAITLDNLALVYTAQGKYDEAEPLYHRALAIMEKALRPEHPDVAICLNNLAHLYHARGNYGRAESFYQRALAMKGELPRQVCWQSILAPLTPQKGRNLFHRHAL